MLGAAFLMATSAIGPGFLTQTATFTSSLGPSFGFVVLISLIMAAIAQMNIWRVLCYTGKRGQDVANEVREALDIVTVSDVRDVLKQTGIGSPRKRPAVKKR